MTQAMHVVLVVEDDVDIRRVLRVTFEAEGYRVVEADTAARAVIEARSHKPDLLCLDLGLPDRDGQTVISAVRAFSRVPILVLSARTQEAAKVAALDAGADDFVTKPFGTAELCARARAALRRAAIGDRGAGPVVIGDCHIDLIGRTARRNGQELHLTPLEFRVLQTLARGTGLVVTQRQLLREAWGPDHGGDSGSLRVCIRNLRDKLEPDPRRPRFIVTEAGLGYRLRVDSR